MSAAQSQVSEQCGFVNICLAFDLSTYKNTARLAKQKKYSHLSKIKVTINMSLSQLFFMMLHLIFMANIKANRKQKREVKGKGGQEGK